MTRGNKVLRRQGLLNPAGSLPWRQAQLNPVASSITGGPREAASSWVQSVLGRVMGGANSSVAPPALAPVLEPAAVATPVVGAASERAVEDGAVSVAQKLLLEVRKAAAVEARAAPAPKTSKKKVLRLSRSQESSRDTPGAEALRKKTAQAQF